MKAVFLLLTLLVAVPARAGGNAAAGKGVYTQNCALCHGASGKGDGPAAAAFHPKPRDFTNAAAMAKIPLETRLKAVTEGGAAAGVSPTMPAFGEMLTPQQIQDVVAFISTLAK